jgi:hypothetical protein
MHPALAARLLAAWDQGSGASAPARALALLAAAAPGEPGIALLALPVGEADRRLLALRRQLLGDRLDAVADCPLCGSATELTLDLAGLSMPAAAPGPVEVEHAGGMAIARPPTMADLLAVAALPQRDVARGALLKRCLLHATDAALPGPVLAQLDAALAAADPQADIELAISCPSCGQEALLPFDIAGLLWREIEAWCARLLAEVHALAQAYGWTERAILGLSPQRRRAYLGLLGQ